MWLLIKTPFPFLLKLKQLLSLIKAFGWFAADQQMLLICRLRFNLSSKWLPKSSPDGSNLIVWLSIVNDIFVRLDFFLSTRIAKNLSGLIIISLLIYQSIAMLLSDSNGSINFETVSQQADRYYHQESYAQRLFQWGKINH